MECRGLPQATTTLLTAPPSVPPRSLPASPCAGRLLVAFGIAPGPGREPAMAISNPASRWRGAMPFAALSRSPIWHPRKANLGQGASSAGTAGIFALPRRRICSNELVSAPVRDGGAWCSRRWPEVAPKAHVSHPSRCAPLPRLTGIRSKLCGDGNNRRRAGMVPVEMGLVRQSATEPRHGRCIGRVGSMPGQCVTRARTPVDLDHCRASTCSRSPTGPRVFRRFGREDGAAFKSSPAAKCCFNTR